MLRNLEKLICMGAIIVKILKKFKNIININDFDLIQIKNSILRLILAGFLLGLAYSKLMIPNDIINGGVTSLSMILYNLTGIPIDTYTKMFTLGFLGISLLFLGKKNFLLSLFSSISYLIFFTIFYNMDFTIQSHILIDFFLSVILISFGYFLCIISDASTVGVEVIALVLKSKNDQIDLAKTISYLNYVILFFGLLVYGIVSVFIGLLFTVFYSKMLGKLLDRYYTYPRT